MNDQLVKKGFRTRESSFYRKEKNEPFKISRSKIAKGSTKRRCPNILKITKLGFRQKCNLNLGLHKTIDWYK